MHDVFANKLATLGLALFDAVEGALGDISTTGAALLLTLFHRPGLTATELAAVAGVSQPTAVRVLEGLAGRGWIARRPRSGRSAPLALTPAGRRRARSLQAARLRAMSPFLEAVPERDRKNVERAVEAMLAGITSSRESARTACRLCDQIACDGPLCPIGTRASEIEQATQC